MITLAFKPTRVRITRIFFCVQSTHFSASFRTTRIVPTMLLYRVECPDGLGAYSCDLGFSAAGTQTSPVPEDDELLDWNGDWGGDWSDVLFAFENIDALHSWFSRADALILSQCCQLSTYECEVYKLGDKQAVFDPARAHLVSRRSLMDFYERPLSVHDWRA